MDKIQRTLASSNNEYDRMISSSILPVWNAVCNKIQIAHHGQKGVSIPKFAKFTFFKDNLMPLFVLSDIFVRKYHGKPYQGSRAATVPTSDLHYAVLGSASGIPSAQAQTAMETIIDQFGKQLRSGSLRIPIGNVGSLVIQGGSLDFKYNAMQSMIKANKSSVDLLPREKANILKKQKSVQKRMQVSNVPQVAIEPAPIVAALPMDELVVEKVCIRKQMKAPVQQPRERVVVAKENLVKPGAESILPRFMLPEQVVRQDAKLVAKRDKVLHDAKVRHQKEMQQKEDLETHLVENIAQRNAAAEERYWHAKVKQGRSQVQVYNNLSSQVAHKQKLDGIAKSQLKNEHGLLFPMEDEKDRVRRAREHRLKLRKGLDVQVREKKHIDKQKQILQLAEEQYYVKSLQTQTNHERQYYEQQSQHTKANLLESWKHDNI